MQPQGKISFGFSKLTKKPALIQKKPQEEKKVELIDCLEGQSIKIKDAVEEINQPLVIPIKDNQKNLLDRVKEARSKQSNSLKKESKEDERPDSELTIEELAARELIKDAKQRLEQSSKTASKILLLPAVDNNLELNGEIEPTLEDYENVPINDFGLAMLRGMGWSEGTGIGKNPSKTSMASAPELRPKGLGLGATREIKGEKPKVSLDKEGKELLLIKGAFAKIIAGNNKGNYCEVQGLDDEAGRVIVKTSLKNEILNVNEFLLVPVTKEEYAKGAKVINNAKYEEYKELMDKKLQKQREAIKKEESRHRDKYSDDRPSASSSRRRDYSSDEDDYKQKSKPGKVINISSDEDKPQRRKHRSRSRSYDRKEKKSKHKKKSRSSSTESSDYDRKKKKKKKKSKSKYRSSSSEPDYKKSHKSRR